MEIKNNHTSQMAGPGFLTAAGIDTRDHWVVVDHIPILQPRDDTGSDVEKHTKARATHHDHGSHTEHIQSSWDNNDRSAVLRARESTDTGK